MLTKRQKEVFDFIKAYSDKHGYSPSIPETAKHFKLAISTVHEHLQRLQDKGQLQKQKNQRRGTELRETERMIQIPLMGVIAAGQPMLSFAETKETIAVPQRMIPKTGDVFALKVSGESMIEENIGDGDIVLVKQQGVAENGQKIVALVDGSDTTLKTYYKEKNQIRLQPENKNFEPIIIKRGRDFLIQGLVLDVIKTSDSEKPDRTFILPENKNKERKGDISGYLNRVYNGDVMHVLRDLPDNSIDMIFGDPDYNVGIKYNENNYTRKFDDYINWYMELARESMRVLKNDGNLFMINYPQQNAHLRVKYLDSHFPNTNEYVWVYNTNVGHTPRRFTTAHRSILHVRKSANNKFFKDAVALPYKNPTDRRIQLNLANGSSGRMPYSWFEFNLVKNVSKEKTLHSCQIPQKLTEMLVKASTKPNDVVFVLFGGSGAEIDVCKNLNRRFISAELDKRYCDIINARIAEGRIPTEYKLIRGRRKTNVYS